MNEFALLIKDDVLDKEQLVLKRYQFLGIDRIQAQFISKLFLNKELEFNCLSIKDIADTINIPADATEAMTKELVSKGIVGLKTIEGEFKFDYNTLINKLIESYIAPLNNSETESILNWIKLTLDFELTESNISDLRLIINEKGYDNLKVAINKLITMSDQTWHQLMSMYEAIGIKEKTDTQDLRHVLKQNWLED